MGRAATLPAWITLLILTLTSLSAAQDATYGTWTVSTEVDAFTDERKAMMYTLSTDHPQYNSNSGLILRCGYAGPNELDIFVSFDDYIGSDDEPFRGAWRFQQDDPNFSARYSPSTDGTAGFILWNDFPTWLDNLEEEGTLAVRVEDYNGTPLDYQFDLTGFTAAWAALDCPDPR